jgi:hypothetical protein
MAVLPRYWMMSLQVLAVLVGKHLNSFIIDAKHVQLIYLVWVVSSFTASLAADIHLVIILNVMSIL